MSGPGNEDDTATAEAGGPPSQNIYREKPVSKVVRVLTVLAYLLSVSFAAILLSVYYICVWKSPDLPELEEPNSLLSARRGDHHDYNLEYPANVLYNLTGRSDITVNDSSTETIENLNYTSSSEITETVTDVSEDMETSIPTELTEVENQTETSSLNITTVT